MPKVYRSESFSSSRPRFVAEINGIVVDGFANKALAETAINKLEGTTPTLETT